MSVRRMLVVFVAVVIGLNIGLRALQGSLGGGPGGPASSSFGTAPSGAAAYGELLRAAGHRVTRSRERPRDLRPAPAQTTLVLLDPGLVDDADAAALRRYRRAGRPARRGGPLRGGWLHELLDDAAGVERRRPSDGYCRSRRAPSSPGSGTSSPFDGSWSSAGETLPLLGGGGAKRAHGRARRPRRGVPARGRRAAPEREPRSRRRRVARPRARRAALRARSIFLEHYHGAGRGWRALPDEWLFTLAGMAVAALAFMLARGRRLGQPEPDERELAPPRALYVESLGALLARTRRPAEALEPLRTRALAAAERLPPSDEDRHALEAEPRTPRAGRRARPRGCAAGAAGGVEALTGIADRVRAEVGKVVLGQDEVVGRLLSALLAGGHVLLEGVPGVAKTLLANATARALGLPFRRAQFTPDMLPSDLTGTMVLREGSVSFRPGPVFTNVLLADEINRTPPKTQAALLEAMQERQVTIEGETRPLPDRSSSSRRRTRSSTRAPIRCRRRSSTASSSSSCSATPTEEVERGILGLRHRGVAPATLDDVQPVVEARELREAQRDLDATGVSDEVLDYVTAVVRATRTLPSVELGASPRAAVHLLAAAKAEARLDERGFVTPDDVLAVTHDVLRHRILLRPEAELERYTPEAAIDAALASVAVPR